jgi:hypothetical protein
MGEGMSEIVKYCVTSFMDDPESNGTALFAAMVLITIGTQPGQIPRIKGIWAEIHKTSSAKFIKLPYD